MIPKHFLFSSLSGFFLFWCYTAICIWILYLILRKRTKYNSLKRYKIFVKSVALFIIITIPTLFINGSVFFFCFLDGPYFGKVIDSDTGEPISNAQVVIAWDINYINILTTNSTVEVYELVTDNNGSFVSPIALKWSPWPFSYLELKGIYIYKPGYLSYPPGLTLSVHDYDLNRCIDKKVYFFKYRVRFSKLKKNIVRLNRALSIEERFVATNIRGLRYMDSRFRHKIRKTKTLLEMERNRIPFKDKYEEKYAKWTQPKIKPTDDRFEILQNGVILDNCTGLMWAAEDNGSPINIISAKEYCKNYRGGGFSDWRIPTIAELETLYEDSAHNETSFNQSFQGKVVSMYCHLNELFEMSNCLFWASETKQGFSAFYNFSSLQWDYTLPSSGDLRVLPVRTSAGLQKGKITDKYNVPYNSW